MYKLSWKIKSYLSDVDPIIYIIRHCDSRSTLLLASTQDNSPDTPHKPQRHTNRQERCEEQRDAEHWPVYTAIAEGLESRGATSPAAITIVGMALMAGMIILWVIRANCVM